MDNKHWPFSCRQASSRQTLDQGGSPWARPGCCSVLGPRAAEARRRQSLETRHPPSSSPGSRDLVSGQRMRLSGIFNVKNYISKIFFLIKYNSSSMTPTCFPNTATPTVTKWTRVLIFVHGVMLTSQQKCDWKNMEKRKRLCKCVMDDGGRVSFAGWFVGWLWVGWYKSPTLILQTFFNI